MSKTVAILSLLFLAPLLSLAHGDKIPIQISGVVSERLAGGAVEGAVISIERNGQVIQSIQTNDKGQFSIKVEGPLGRMDQIRISVYKSGYKTADYVPVNCNNSQIKIELERKEAIPILRPFGGAASMSI